MTREKQIIEAAEKATYQKPPQYSELVHKARKVMNAYEVGFIDGCVWADETMIDKACEWLTNYFVKYLQFDEQIVKDFRKAMKGGES